MTDYSELQTRCQRGEASLAGANNLLAECHAALGRMIAENARIKARLCVCRDCGGQGEIYSGHSSYQGHNQPPEPDMDVCGTCGGDGVLGPLEDFEALAAERDQLKAENEALRKDAERFAYIERDADSGMSKIYGDDRVAVIDAAMSKEVER
ncbi:hypothetical protein [Pseudomonas chlororaphis]|uniref:hypothetical protein n=1 Tax=Pseudomonas chlororaphis TaxID=587753 RepID=UPI00068AC897|nr:hypothetical protein [Pseudomonas chlororaphis]